ncbi:SET domain-containing protein 9-like [Thrips palmi]|uniref:SET domain-containing protein 9-like n=1 Tax=Thrips palmi TaxID=161013 RepID=A0A6P8ZL16_THRPL|nr:SET domain-containing protein 9-like [Thrips palmi]
MDSSLSKIWKNYRHRFVPWMAANIKTAQRRVVAVSTDKTASDEDLKKAVLKVTYNLDKKFRKSLEIDTESIMLNVLGYSVKRMKSRLKGGGTGVVLSLGSAQKGDLIAFYPGTLYRRFEPLLLPSLGNQFILRCMDGIHVDGNDRFLSKSIFHSCVNRDSFGQYRAADTSWITKQPVVPWNIGQYVNNGTKECPPNVAYQEFDIENFPPELDYLLPNIWYSGPRGRHLRTVALVATRKIQQGDEIFSNYVTLLHDH